MTQRAPVVIAAYDPEWPALFERERAALIALLPGVAPSIEHVGSTSVPGLAAKPIVDMLLGCGELGDFEARIPALEAAGWRYMPEFERVLPDRRFLTKPASEPRSFHLHAVARGGSFWRRHLRFRDALRADSSLALEYETLKRELAVRFVDDAEGYTRAKAPFIERVLASAD